MGVFSAHLLDCARKAKEIELSPQHHQANTMATLGLRMNYALGQREDFSRDNYLRMKEEKHKLAQTIRELSDEADFRVKSCSEQVRILGDERTRLAAEKGRLYDEQDATKLQLSDLEAKLVAYQTSINTLLLQIGVQQAAVGVLCEKKRKAEEKERDINKNWWKLLIPGYGLYVGIDYLTDEDVQHLNSLSQNIQRNQEDVNGKRNTLDNLKRELEGKKSEQSALGAQVVNLEQAIGKTISRINEANRNLVQWMELQDYYNTLAAKLQADNCDIEAIRGQLIDLPNKLEKIA